ncbi:MAG: glutamine--fructose-6-phosphate transaminase (isomerizing) [Candidatus Woesearchaeota archaeon]
MCGIIGYKGGANATGIVIQGLKSMEYRGYDSWGIAIKNAKIKVLRKVGKVGDFNGELPESNIAIGHTRWATHGSATEANSHPHSDCSGKIQVVHNGIIENYRELKQELISIGHKFCSETDTEVIPHLIEEFMKTNSFESSTQLAIRKLKGNYAILTIHENENKMVAARNGSPLVVGIKDNEYFVASDIPAFLKHTRDVVFLDDNEMAVINEDIRFINILNGNENDKKISKVEWNIEQAQKGNYDHYMLKEIIEQKQSLANVANRDTKKIEDFANAINNSFGVFFVACGTAYHAALVGSYLFSSITKKHVNVVLGSEFPNYKDFITEKSLIIPISQSGETADVIASVKSAKEKGAKVYSIVNSVSSSLVRYSDDFLPLGAGLEMAVASTKAFTSQVAILALLAFACANKTEEGKQKLNDLITKVNMLMNDPFLNCIKTLALQIKKNDLFTIGRSINYPIAMEAALKIKEVSYIHAEGYAGGELKHGPIALIENGTPCIVFASNDKNKYDIISNATEIKARGGYIIGVSPERNEVFDYWIFVPDAGEMSPIVNVIPAQLLAYYLALNKNLDPDKPRNLAKSVTVF